MRCEWSNLNPLMQQYHDIEWGTPVHDDRLFFEHITLDVFQAGLSWNTILAKRENFRVAFDNFLVNKIATYNEQKIEELLSNSAIIRNRMKIEATIKNARSFITIQKKFGTFNFYIWGFTNQKTHHNAFTTMSEIPASSILSDTISKDMKKHGFSFIGSTICYAFLQATGIVNDHVTSCFRYKELTNP